MKRLFALLITIIMVASLAACGTNNSNTNENNSSANGNESGGTVENAMIPGSTSTYNFPGYTTEGTWADATAWAGMGLPNLPVSNAGKVSISDKEWIYPLNAKDGVLFEARPESSHFDELVAALNAAGIEGEDNSDSFDKYYEADYTYNGAQMDIKISEYDTGKLTILVRYEPEN